MSPENRPDDEGLVRFECTKCGACCRLPEMIVTVTGADLRRLASALDISVPVLMRALDFYVLSENETIPDGMREIPRVKTEQGLAYIALRKMDDGSCIFLDGNLCMIHPARPSVCRTFPFIFRREDGKTAWGLHARRDICQGLGRGPIVQRDELADMARSSISELEELREDFEYWNLTEPEPIATDLVRFLLSGGKKAVRSD